MVMFYAVEVRCSSVIRFRVMPLRMNEREPRRSRDKVISLTLLGECFNRHSTVIVISYGALLQSFMMYLNIVE